MSPDQRRLLLLRHAKAATAPEVTDHDRPLAARGHDEAPAAGRWMREHDVVPDFILCSSALRTRQTTTWVCQELGEKAPTPQLRDDLYNAGTTGMLTVINHVPETVRTLLVVAHFPAVQNVALRLASPESDQDAVTDLGTDYPTLGLAVLELDLPWAELDRRDAAVTAFAVPR
ncbi:histidine phosphatase family protein [Tersicoccus sp. MR15.9]|uniref:SixA phosphatase family protein n=1 Tax=Tersicoccus mangrovi TaxID=3121635 RepID=UPI002FE5594E